MPQTCVECLIDPGQCFDVRARIVPRRRARTTREEAPSAGTSSSRSAAAPSLPAGLWSRTRTSWPPPCARRRRRPAHLALQGDPASITSRIACASASSATRRWTCRRSRGRIATRAPRTGSEGRDRTYALRRGGARLDRARGRRPALCPCAAYQPHGLSVPSVSLPWPSTRSRRRSGRDGPGPLGSLDDGQLERARSRSRSRLPTWRQSGSAPLCKIDAVKRRAKRADHASIFAGSCPGTS